MNSMKRQKVMTLKDELPRLVCDNMLLEKSGGIAPETMKSGAKAKQCPAVHATGDGSSLML